MKARIVILLALLCLCLCFIQGVRAEENRELKKQLNMMEKQIEESKKRIEQLESVIPSGKVSGPKYVASKELVEKFELGGEVSIQFVDTQNDDATSEPEPHFDLDKVSLMPAIQMTEDLRFEAELEIEEGEANLDESYFIFSNLPLHSTFQIGKDDRFFKAERYTEKYPLTGNAFWRDEEIGILWKTEIKPFYTVLSWSNGLELSSRPSGEDESYEIIHDNTKTGNYAGIRQISGGLGFIGFLGKSAQIDILGWGLYNKLSQADIDFLKTELNNYTSNNDDQHRIGLNLNLILAEFELGAQYIDAKDGKLDRAAWFVQPSYKVALPFDWKYFNKYRLLIRYGELEVDYPESFGIPMTWDREEVTIAVITEISHNFKLKSEYTINDENTGNGNVDNNELLMRLEYEF